MPGAATSQPVLQRPIRGPRPTALMEILQRRKGVYDDAIAAPLTVAPSVFGNARLAYELGQDRPTLAVVGRCTGKRLADDAFVAGWVPYAPPQTELRFTVSGPAPFIRGLSYRGSVDYAFAHASPYVIGPVPQPIPGSKATPT